MQHMTNFFELPQLRHPLRWAAACLAAVGLLVVTAGPAHAHADHPPLTEDFHAHITQVTAEDGTAVAPDDLDGINFAISPNGNRVTVTNEGDGELIIPGEQAVEPLLRLTSDGVDVNAASPQAVLVEGTDVDPATAADLLDLVWDRVEPDWVPVTDASTVSFLDHRAVPGHPPERSRFATGDVVTTWRIPFILEGSPYVLNGEVVAAEVPGGSGRLLVAALILAGMLATAAVTVKRRRMARRTPATPQPLKAPKVLTGARSD